MKSKIIILLLPLFLAGGAYAQERSFGTLPLVNKPGAAIMDGGSMEGTPEYKKALDIYEKLVAARGDFRFPVPTFKMTKEERRAAGMDYETLEITLEKKAFDICNSYGEGVSEAAIAFLLGHELTHYYEKHAWRRGFASTYKDLPIGIKLDSLADDTAHETEADYLGGFLAYSAGYGLFDKGGKVIEKLYEGYKLGEKMPGYPSKSDRQAMSKRTAEKLKELVDIFEMANLLTAIGNYPEAYEYYRKVLLEYQSREIYNNLGVTAVLDALQYFKEGELKYRYPVELDLESSAEKGSGAMDARTKLLQQALLHFDAAISMDPNYAPAYLNKACTYALLGDTLRARFYAEQEARPVAEKKDIKNGLKGYPKTAIDVNILIGILEAGAGRLDAAKKQFKSASDAYNKLFNKEAGKMNSLADINLKIANGEPIEIEKVKPGGLPKVERIDETKMADAINEFSDYTSVTINANLQFHRALTQWPNSRVYASQNDREGVYTYFQMTNPDYTGTAARGSIALGATRAEITAKTAYGEPERTIETPRGQILVYKAIIFIIGADGKLERWVNYMKN